MAKKIGIIALLLFGVYAVGMYFYIFQSGSGEIPAALKGTVADPAVFMSHHELLLSGEYSKIRNYLFFVSTPLEWLIYLFILLAGLSKLFEKWSVSRAKSTLFQTIIYVFWLSLLMYLVLWPLDYYKYHLSKDYGISTQTFPSWMKDGIIDFGVNLVTSILVMSVVYWLIKKVLRDGGYMLGCYRYHFQFSSCLCNRC